MRIELFKEKKCKDCKGKGRWLKRIETDNEVEEWYYECGTCKATGTIQDGAEPAYDIDGEEEDDY